MKSLSPTKPAPLLATREEIQKSVQRVRQRSLQTTLVFWGFVGPLILGLIVFFYIPILWSIVLSFASARATITPTSFVGLQNYREMLGDPEFIKALVTFTIFAVVCLGGILFTITRVPETTGHSLEAIEIHLRSGQPLAALKRIVVPIAAAAK